MFLQLRSFDKKSAHSSGPDRERIVATLKQSDEHTMGSLRKFLPFFGKECVALGLTSSASQVRRICSRLEVTSPGLPPDLDDLLRDLLLRVEDDLENQVFLAVDSSHRAYYENRKAIWGNATEERFGQAVLDMEEAGKCFALNRYAACVFHLMRVTEAGVLALGELLELEDHKAHFGSVLDRIEKL